MLVNHGEDFVLTGGRLCCPDGVRASAWLRVTGERIREIGTGQPPECRRVELDGRLVVPGFIDTHCHGGGGGSFSAVDQDEAMRAIAAHRAHGTTTMVASLVSDPLPALREQLASLADLVTGGELAGIHLEGPFIAGARCGAHDPDALREPDDDTVEELLTAGKGHVRMMTLAPELTGGVKAVRRLSESGVIAALGHTDGLGEHMREAVDAGATVATHLFNGMRPLHHREPGPIGVLLDDERVTVELICDFVHVHPTVLRLAARHAGALRTLLITDAMSATDATDGDYQLGRLAVQVRDGVAKLANGSLAGSTLTMDSAFRNAITGGGLTVPEAVRATSGRPAELLGIAGHTGTLREGHYADLVILDDDLRPERVLRRGADVIPSSGNAAP